MARNVEGVGGSVIRSPKRRRDRVFMHKEEGCLEARPEFLDADSNIKTTLSLREGLASAYAAGRLARAPQKHAEQPSSHK